LTAMMTFRWGFASSERYFAGCVWR
jgi:hypothetical protein